MQFDPTFEELCVQLASQSHRHLTTADWPSLALSNCGEANAFYGFSGLPIPSVPGSEWSTEMQTLAWIRLAEADLLVTFVATQHLGAIKRILGSDQFVQNGAPKAISETVASLLLGNETASVGISHLTTSRRHLSKPAVAVEKIDGGFRFNGTIPWVTGASHVQQIVVGGTLPDENEVLALISPNQAGVFPGPGADMIAMTASCTDAVELKDVIVSDEMVLSGPRPSVLSTSVLEPVKKAKPVKKEKSALPSIGDKTNASQSGGAGGLQTSALAVGLSRAALGYLRDESQKREGLRPIVAQFSKECDQVQTALMQMAGGKMTSSPNDVRANANSLANRITSAAMTTAKGAGLMTGHPVARYCQQAFFFLVWSCPPPVAEAHLCELAFV